MSCFYVTYLTMDLSVEFFSLCCKGECV